jgi:S1-C subfamily serine protease
MKRVMVLALVLSTGVATVAEAAPSTKYKNCAQLRKKYPDGVAINFSVVGTSRARIIRPVYLRNQHLDRDRDGIICEWEIFQYSPPPTTAPATLRTPVEDLSAFVDKFGSAVATLECDSDDETTTGSGTSISVLFSSADVQAKGIRSALVTNHHVVSDCIWGSWLDRKVLVRTREVECVGYVWTWNKTKDLAIVYTTCEIPAVLGFSYSEVTKPSIGDIAIAIGSTSGIAGTSTQGAIANVGESEILTTAQAGPGSSGGALFNRNGQMLGIIQGGVGSLTSVIPITAFSGAVLSANVTWK